MVTNLIKCRNKNSAKRWLENGLSCQPMGGNAALHPREARAFFFLLGGGLREREGWVLDYLFYFSCSQCVLIKFSWGSSGSQCVVIKKKEILMEVPQVLNVFPKMFPIAPHFEELKHENSLTSVPYENVNEVHTFLV